MGILPERPLRVSEPFFAARHRRLFILELALARGGDPVLLPEDLRVFEMSASDRAATLVRAATR